MSKGTINVSRNNRNTLRALTKAPGFSSVQQTQSSGNGAAQIPTASLPSGPPWKCRHFLWILHIPEKHVVNIA